MFLMPISFEKSLLKSLPITIRIAITTQLIKISLAPRPNLSAVKLEERLEKTIAGKNTFVCSVARFVVALLFNLPLLPSIKPISVKENITIICSSVVKNVVPKKIRLFNKLNYNNTYTFILYLFYFFVK